MMTLILYDLLISFNQLIVCLGKDFSWLCPSDSLSKIRTISMAGPTLPAKFLENYEAKSKEQIFRKIGEIWKNFHLRTVTFPILHCKK